jgi:hypothetical protein
LTADHPGGTVMSRSVEIAMAGRVRLLSILVIAAAALRLGSPAQSASWLEKNFWLEGPGYDGVVPACDDPAALGRIISRFATKERRFWNSALEIRRIDHIRETAFRPWERDLIPRRFCSARALISDGRTSRMYYWIGEDTGMIGASWGVEWCVVGYDRNWAYYPNCRMAQP